MLQMNDLHEKEIYMHDNRQVFARLVRWLGDSESGGVATIELAGDVTNVGLAYFLRKYNVITVQELADHANQSQG